MICMQKEGSGATPAQKALSLIHLDPINPKATDLSPIRKNRIENLFVSVTQRDRDPIFRKVVFHLLKEIGE